MQPSSDKYSNYYIKNKGFNNLNLQFEKEISNFLRVDFDYPSANARMPWSLLLNDPLSESEDVKEEVKEENFEIESINDFFWI